MKQTLRFFDNLFHLVSGIIMSFIKRLAPFVTAVLPGFFFGYTIYQFVMVLTRSPFAAGFIGFSAFVALESAGIWSGHKIADYIGRGWIILIPIATFVLYTSIGIGSLWLLESIPFDVQIVGTATFLLAGVVYILFGLQMYEDQQELKAKVEVKNERSLQIEDEERKRKLEIENQERLRQEKKEDEDREFQRKLQLKETNARLKREQEELALRGEVAIVKVGGHQRQTAVGEYRPNMEKIQELRKWRKALPNMEKQKLAEKLGVSRPTLDKYLEWLSNQGE